MLPSLARLACPVGTPGNSQQSTYRDPKTDPFLSAMHEYMLEHTDLSDLCFWVRKWCSLNTEMCNETTWERASNAFHGNNGITEAIRDAVYKDYALKDLPIRQRQKTIVTTTWEQFFKLLCKQFRILDDNTKKRWVHAVKNGWTAQRKAFMLHGGYLGIRTLTKLLREWGATDNITAYMAANNALKAAIRTESDEQIRQRLQQGATLEFLNVNEKTDGTTLLMDAVINYKPHAIWHILQHPVVDLEIKDELGRTALMYAVNGKSIEIIQQLLNAGADIDAKDYNHFTPLMVVLQQNKPEIAKLLIEKGAGINEATNGWTPLTIALQYSTPEIAKLLIEKNAEINVAKIADGWTPLMIALRRANEHPSMPEMAKLLIEKGAKINVANRDSWTPLMFAVKYSTPEIVQLLLDKEADTTPKSKYNKTAMDYATNENKLVLLKHEQKQMKEKEQQMREKEQQLADKIARLRSAMQT